MKVTIFGAGYVGLVQAAVLAEAGHEVMCVDIDRTRIDELNAGHVRIFEPDLDGLVLRNLRDGRLRFTTEAARGVAHAPILFIAVGTPASEDGSADQSHVAAVARSIGALMAAPKTVVIKSTVPVGTNAMVRGLIAEASRAAGRDIAFDVVSNPEFLREGAAVDDCSKPDRIILGTASRAAEATLRQLYAPFNRNHEKIIVMDERSAELTKYAANSMLATKISFMNEIANLADRLGADIESVRKGIGADPRIGYAFIYPGIGYGGSCFPKDVQALIHSAEAAGVDPLLIRAVRDRNEAQKHVLIDKISRYFGGDLAGRSFALWGLAFKPGTDDMREAPARAIMEALWRAGASVRAYDPEAMAECARLYGERPDLVLATSRDDALTGADALIIATEWRLFQSPDFATIRARLKTPVLFDGRNLFDPAQVAAEGLDYFAIGRGKR
jgi:UDPglucose 6-dehydrogenase